MQSSSCVSGWLWELDVLEMGLAKEFSASGLAVIMGYLQAAYHRSEHSAAAHGGKPECTRLEEPEKLAQAELCVGTALLSAPSLDPAQAPSLFSASEEIIITLANYPFLLQRLLFFCLNTEAPSPLFSFTTSLTNTFCDSYLLPASLHSLAVFLWPTPPFSTQGTGCLYLNFSLEGACQELCC